MADPGPAAELTPEVDDLAAALRRSEQRVEAIQAIAAAVGSSLDLDEVLLVILDKITQLMDAERSTLFLLMEDRKTLVSRIAQGTRGETEIRVAVGEGIAGWVARTGRSLNIKDAYQDPRFQSDWDKETGYRTSSILCVPMRNLRRRILGVVEVLNKKSGYFTVDDESLLSALAGQAAITVENAKLFAGAVRRNVELLETQAQLQQKIRELDALFEVEQEVPRAEDVDQLLSRALHKTVDVLDAEAGSILLVDQHGVGEPTLSFRAAVGESADKAMRVRLSPGEGIIGWVAARGEPLRVDSVADDERHSKRITDEVGFDVRTELAAPLVAGGNSLGAISVLNKRGKGRTFTDDDEKVLALVAGQIARAFKLRKQRDEEEKEDRLAGIGRMLSGILHDLKTPLTISSGYVQLMERKEEPEERARCSRLVLDQFERMSDMIKEVLAFARGDSVLLVRKVYLNQFVAGLRETIAAQVEGKGIELTVRLGETGTVWFDEAKLLRVIQNLCRNAIEAMPEGGELTVSLDLAERDLVLRVQDTGLGIPEEIRDRLFESFVTEGKEHGSGLGLAIVKKIVENHGGTVTFRSRKSRGTTFIARIPRRR